jgi:hypothetical protein
MRVFTTVICLTCLGTGVALADPAAPAAATVATPAAPPAAATPASSPVAAAAAAAKPAAASTTAASAAGAPTSAFEKQLIAKGYKPAMYGDQKMYCHEEQVLGSRLGGKKVCATADQLAIDQQNAKELTEHAQKMPVNGGL